MAPVVELPSRNPRALPIPLQFWATHIEEVLLHFATRNTAAGALAETQASVNAREQVFYPSVSTGIQLNRGQTRLYDGGTEINSSAPESNVQLSLSTRLNLFRGGADLKNLTLAQRRQAIAAFKNQVAVRSHVRAWLKDVARIDYQKRVLELHAQANQQAVALNKLALRKEASGFLGKRDLLDSQRELLRVEQDTQSAQQTLQELITRHIRLYGVKSPESIPQSGFKKLESFQKVDAFQNGSASQLSTLLPVMITQLEADVAAKEQALASMVRFSPSIDASAQASHSQLLTSSSGQNAQIAGPTAGSSGRSTSSRNWSISVSGTLSLNPPTAFGAVEESVQRLTIAKQAEQRALDQVSLSLESSVLKIKQLRERFKKLQELASVTKQMWDKNQRLFEAGELSIDRMISSQQELNRDQLSLAATEFEGLLLNIDFVFLNTWDLPPESSVSAGDL
jgi:outer membrane protein TolC